MFDETADIDYHKQAASFLQALFIGRQRAEGLRGSAAAAVRPARDKKGRTP